MNLTKNIKAIHLISIAFILFSLGRMAILQIPSFMEFKLKHLAKIMDIWFNAMVIMNILISIWLFIDAKKKKSLPFVWAALSLFFGIKVVFVYYWRLIYLEWKKNEDTN